MAQELIKNLLPQFIEDLKVKGRSPSTILAYRADLEQLTDFVSQTNKVLADQVMANDLEQFRDSLLEQKYTPKTVSRKLNAVKTFFRWMKGNAFIPEDVSKDVSHPKIEASMPKFLSELEYRALRDVVRADNRIAAIVELILQTGMRISEVANLKLTNLKDGEIIIEKYATQPKRTIPLNQPAKLALDNHLTGRPEIQSEYVFISKNGKPLAVRNIRAAIDRYMQKAQVPDYSVNDLRTTFIVENLKRGVDLTIISKAAGHKRLSTTERYLELAEIKEAGKKPQLEEL